MRMTEKGPNGYFIPAERGRFSVDTEWPKDFYGSKWPKVKFTGTIVDRMGQYEDCGLEPQEAIQMAQDWTKFETAMSYVDGLGGVEELKRLVAQKNGVTKTYPEYILRDLRQRWGMKPDDTSRDEMFQSMEPRAVFGEVLTWNGLLGGWDRQIVGWIKDIFCVDLEG